MNEIKSHQNFFYSLVGCGLECGEPQDVVCKIRAICTARFSIKEHIKDG